MENYVNVFIVSLIGGISAASANHLFNIIKEKSNKNRVIIDGCFSEIFKIMDECNLISREIWSEKGGKFLLKEAEIVALVQDLSNIVGFIGEHVSNMNLRGRPKLSNFHRSLTGDDFDVKNRKADLGRITKIRSDAISLKVALLEAQFRNNYLFSS